MATENWFVDEEDGPEPQVATFTEFDITAAPNDFNVKTLFDLINSNIILIPPFQRNFVWDLKRASRLIESLVMGLPIPQVFLYEKKKNEFLVIDGQQRLLSIYYFLKQRFPILKARSELRKQLARRAVVPDSLLANNEFFTGFTLNLPLESPKQNHPLEGLAYDDLGAHKTALDLRTIRVVIVKQHSPKGDDAIYEIFNRLNSGGVNLTPQEIRVSLYHSSFLAMLAELNFDERWRRILGQKEPDLHLKDVEILLRGLALLAIGHNYQPSMARFLNLFASRCETSGQQDVDYFQSLVDSFLTACGSLPQEAFYGQANKFTVSIFDAVFAAVCAKPFRSRKLVTMKLDSKRLRKLKADQEFFAAAQARTTGTGNVKKRIELAKRILMG